MRPQIDDDDLGDEVRKYAKENGIRMPRAWSELVWAGLEEKRGEA